MFLTAENISNILENCINSSSENRKIVTENGVEIFCKYEISKTVSINRLN